MKNWLFIISLLIIFSCREQMLDDGIITTVSGTISDKFGEPIPNLEVNVGEFKKTGSYGSVYLVKLLVTATTNQKGEYSITFTTTGSGSSCQLFIKPDYGVPRKYLGDIQAEPITPLGGNTTINNKDFFNLVPCAVTFDTNNSTVFPISVFHNPTNMFNNQYSISAKGIETKTFYTTKYFAEPIQFGYTNSAGVYKKTFKTIPLGSFMLQNPYLITLEDSDFQ